MEMKASEDIAIGEDITPPLFPLSFSLHDSFLHTHCSSCFSPLPSPPSPSLLPLYCSPLCSSSGSSLYFSSAESHLLSSSSLLRAALRLFHSLPSISPSRIFGLLTNRHHLISEHDEMSALVRNGARAIAAARRLRDGNENEIENENENEDDVFLEEEAALCAVLTNAVEVQDKEGRNLGIAVYDVNFSWINHSCSPNACYRFLISPPGGPLDKADSTLLRIVPAGSSVKS